LAALGIAQATLRLRSGHRLGSALVFTKFAQNLEFIRLRWASPDRSRLRVSSPDKFFELSGLSGLGLLFCKFNFWESWYKTAILLRKSIDYYNFKTV